MGIWEFLNSPRPVEKRMPPPFPSVYLESPRGFPKLRPPKPLSPKPYMLNPKPPYALGKPPYGKFPKVGSNLGTPKY